MPNEIDDLVSQFDVQNKTGCSYCVFCLRTLYFWAIHHQRNNEHSGMNLVNNEFQRTVGKAPF